MISIVAAWLLIPFLAFMAFFVFFGLVNIVHLLHYGPSLTLATLASIVFVGGSVVIIGYAWVALLGVDWGITYPLFNAGVLDGTGI